MRDSADSDTHVPPEQERRPPPLWLGSERIRFGILVGFLLLCALGGGASRGDVLSLVYLRPAAIVCILAMAIVRGPWHFRSLKIPFILLGVFAAVVAVQLLPLPPELWLKLPGRQSYAEAAAAAGFAQPWRPVTLTPDLTVNSLLAFLPPLAVLVGLAGLSESRRQALLPIIIALICGSALLGIAQLNGSTDSPAFLYRIRHENSAVGLFANRNHQAALLAMAFPLLRLWTLTPASGSNHQRNRFWIATAIGLFLVPMILVVGSRAGMGLALLGILSAYFMAPGEGMALRQLDRRWRTPVRVGLWLTPVALGAMVILLGRAVAIQRLFLHENAESELRTANTPLTLHMTGDFFPVGSGFGSFDPIFRTYEPDRSLSPLYFNHAHNDLIELGLSGGAPALLVLAAFLLWWARNSWSAFLPYRSARIGVLFARAGAIMILLLLLASLVDYPLRTPLLSVIFVIACAWLSGPRAGRAG
jgi:O-antigen ligase